MSINRFKCRICKCPLRLDINWPVHRAKHRHYICDEHNKSICAPRIPRGHGYVYLVRNQNHPGRYKIGKSRNPEVRVETLNTACPDRAMVLVTKWYDQDYSGLEREVHICLNEYRLPGTEWFEGDGENLRSIINVIHRQRSLTGHTD